MKKNPAEAVEPRDAPAPRISTDAPWYEKAFESGYLKIYAHRNDADAARALAFLESHARLNPRMRLLDLCCGPGRHLAHVAPHVGQAWGLDLSTPLLLEAREALSDLCANHPPTCPRLVQADMRHLPFAPASFDAVINMFTSFGYFENEAENEHVLAEIARILRPGALLVLDHINRPYLESTLQPETRRRLPNGIQVIERRGLDRERRRVRKQIEWIEPDRGRLEWIESVRVYHPEEIDRCLNAAGLDAQSWHGDFDGCALSPESPRMIVVARRKA